MTVTSWLLPAFAGHRARLLLAVAVLLVGNGASALAAWWLGGALDGRRDPWTSAGLYLGAVAGSAVATWWARVAIERVAQSAMLRVKARLFRHLLHHDVALHDELGAGRLVSRVGGDVEALRTLLSEAVLQAPNDLATALVLLAVLGVTAPALALVSALSLPFYAILLVWYRRVAPARMLAARELAARLTGFYAEMLRALPLLRVYRRRAWAAAQGAELAREKEAVDVAAGMAGVHFFNLLFGVRSLALAGIVWVGAVQVSAGAMSAGLLLVALDYARKLIEPFLRLQFHLTTLERARAGAVRVTELLDRAPAIGSPPRPAPWPGGALEVRDVELAYVPGLPVLRGVSFRLEPGQRVALVGPTGGGKSSIVALLLRFRDPDRGAVCVGGVDVRAMDLAELRRRIGFVSQGVHLLPGTVAENLGLDERGAEELLERVGLRARLSPTTRVGPGGESVSRGEAQLLCFARALAGGPELLVLDEATASMDPDTEARVAAVVAAAGVPVLAVAHRLRTVRGFDLLHVVDGGRIVESGTHEALLARRGMYAGLWRAQLAGAE